MGLLSSLGFHKARRQAESKMQLRVRVGDEWFGQHGGLLQIGLKATNQGLMR